jgi:hypothetical protein
VENRDFKEFACLTGRGKERNFINEIDFKEFFDGREQRALSNK